jgi:hypothetical protein
MSLSSTSDGGRGGRKTVDSEINMVPMIDLLMCCISFLMLTATWSSWARMQADADIPGEARCADCRAYQAQSLHVEARYGQRFTLTWKQGNAVLRSVDVPRNGVAAASGAARYPELAAALRSEWRAVEASGAAPRGPMQAVLHCDHATRFDDMAAVMDAVMSPQRAYAGAARAMPAFQIALAQN